MPPSPGETPDPPRTVYPNGLVITQDNAVFENLEVSNPDGVCIKITGDNVTIRHSVIHDCRSHGVQFVGTNGGVFEGNVIHDAALAIPPDTAEGGWPSSLNDARRSRPSTSTLAARARRSASDQVLRPEQVDSDGRRATRRSSWLGLLTRAAEI